MAPDILTKSRTGSDHGQPRSSNPTPGEDSATQGGGHGLVTQSRTPKDSSKEGTTKEWHYPRGYSDRPLARNKAPEPMGAMNYGSIGPYFKV